MSVSSAQNNKFANIPPLNEAYTTPASKARTVTILGSSRTIEPLQEWMDLCSKVTKGLVDNGYNVLSGCGQNGIMGAAYKSAEKASIKDANGRPIQNLAILAGWADEDIEHCLPIGMSTSEADRIDKFAKVSDNFVIFPGGETSLQEITSLTPKNKYLKEGDSFKKIILVSQEFFHGLLQQYKKGIEWGTITTPFEKLFKVLDSEADILKEFPKLNRLI